MRSPPFSVECLYFIICEPIRLKFSPRIDASHVSKGEIAGFPHVPLGAILCVGTTRSAENATCGFTIRFVTLIACCVITPICIELPFFAGNPCQNPALDSAEVGTDQYVAGRSYDR